MDEKQILANNDKAAAEAHNSAASMDREIQAGPISTSPNGPYGESQPPGYQLEAQLDAAPTAGLVAAPVVATIFAAPGQAMIVNGVEGVQVAGTSYIEVADMPARVTCPKCQKDIVTQIETKTGTRTVVVAVAVFIAFWPLVWVPFMSKRLKKKIHVCPHCHHKLGKIISLTTVGPVHQ
ncbi:hypothetical protein LPJ66_004058 [Kickxella alabastrina]|uniref:Uncharacterized protein n=1 Tax=Kickxella alabastrina TaxID=61397 RepID=A0ACC1IIL8_9FUNG|nr:hypothetical protein LPJ66_004058 [Kickxella alabastrina]